MQPNFDEPEVVEHSVVIELGRTTLSRPDAERLDLNAVLPLDQAADEPVNVYADGHLVARGEIVVQDDRFGVRVTEIVEAINAVA